MKGRPPDPTRRRRGTGHRPQAGEQRVELVPALPEVIDVDDEEALAEIVPMRLPPALEPPDDLPEEIAPLWRTAVGELEPRGIRPADLEAVRLMCMAALRARQAGEQIAKYGVLVKGARGPMPNPMLRVEKDATATYLRLAEQFGLTVASRMRLGLIQLTGESILATLDSDLNEGR